MTPERYRQVGELFHAALEIEADKRSAFLDRACEGDPALRREVESLIASSEQSPDFIGASAFAVAAKTLAKDESASLIGRTLGRYRIISLIGAGGMGRVYLGEDTMLARRVALKLLPDHLTSDRSQVQRFRQEAFAASALNHPNILTVFEVGLADGMEFIATEYVEGETLRAHMSRDRVVLREALDIAQQIADALVASHQAGIIHRDIKPENVMIRHDGYVKILDFGLAKLTETVSMLRPADFEAPTKAAIKTNPGMVMGTADYMSPEQARGLIVDARSDVWSVGVVVYEMVTRQRPFAGPTHSDTLAAILEREPKPLLSHSSDTPAELDRIVMKALSKDADERYQTMKDMAIDLRRLRRRLEVAAEINRSGKSDAKGDSISVENDGSEHASMATNVQGALVSTNELTRTTSNLEYAVSQINKHKRMALTLSSVLVLLLGGTIFGLYKLLSNPKPAHLPFQSTEVTPLTATGKAWDAAISPDGKYLVYIDNDAGSQSLWVKQVVTGSAVEILPADDSGYWGLTFSNDGNYVYFVKTQRTSSVNILYKVPSLGGPPKKLLEHVDSAVSFSPDGQRLAFVRDFLKKQETTVVLSDVDGGNEQTLATRKRPLFFWSDAAVRISWSPDGKTIACPGRNQQSDAHYYFDVVAVSVDDGSERPLTSEQWVRVQQVSWLGDGRGLIMTASNQASGSMQLYYISYPGGKVRRITNDLNNYSDITLTSDSNTLATVQKNRVSNIWVGPKEDLKTARQITSGTLDGEAGLTWTPDGRIVYRSNASGKSDIWIMDADGRNQKKLTHEGQFNTRPTVSSDARYIIFASHRDGKVNVWRMDIDGGNQTQLTNGKTNSNPYVSPDGQSVVYASWDQGNGTLWKVPIGGGKSVQLTGPTANLPIVSPDGKYIACYYWDEQADPPRGVMIFPVEGGPPIKRFNIRSGRDGFALGWTLDGRAILFLRNMTNIWGQPVDGGEPAQLTDFQGDQLFNFAYSADGKRLAVARGRVTDDVVLIRDVR